MPVDYIVEQNTHEIVHVSRIHITVSSFWETKMGLKGEWEEGENLK